MAFVSLCTFSNSLKNKRLYVHDSTNAFMPLFVLNWSCSHQTIKNDDKCSVSNRHWSTMFIWLLYTLWYWYIILMLPHCHFYLLFWQFFHPKNSFIIFNATFTFLFLFHFDLDVWKEYFKISLRMALYDVRSFRT